MENLTLSKKDIWLLAIRPKTLPAAVAPVIVGSAFAYKLSDFLLLPGLATLIAALLLQIAANFANDYYDFIKGIDQYERLGPPRVAASGLISLTELRMGLIFTIALSMMIGLYLIYVRGIVILIIGLLSLFALITYSGTVIAFGYRALGDLLVFVFFGLFAVNGTYFVHSGTLDFDVFVGSIPSGFLITAILVVNNYRDLETDKKTGKKTLAVLIGKRGTAIEFSFLLIGSYLILLYYIFNEYTYFVLLPFLTLHIALKLIHEMNANEGKSLNTTLAKTAQMGLYFNFLFAIGLLI